MRSYVMYVTINNIHVKNLIAEITDGLEEIWIFGTSQFLTRATPLLEKLRRRKCKQNDYKPMYMYRNFTMRWFIEYNYKDNAILQLRQALAAALKRFAKLPSFLLIIFDDSFEEKFVKFGTSDTFDWITWVVDQFIKGVNYRRQVLPSFAKREYYPKVFLVRTPPKPSWSRELMNIRHDFNVIIERVVRNSRVEGTISVTQFMPAESSVIYHKNGALTSDGLIYYWMALDEAVQVAVKDQKCRDAVELLARFKKLPSRFLLPPRPHQQDDNDNRSYKK